MQLRILPIALSVLSALACSANVKVAPVEVKPIKMTIDVNIKVDRQLDNFFDFEEETQGAEPEAPTEGKG